MSDRNRTTIISNVFNYLIKSYTIHKLSEPFGSTRHSVWIKWKVITRQIILEIIISWFYNANMCTVCSEWFLQNTIEIIFLKLDNVNATLYITLLWSCSGANLRVQLLQLLGSQSQGGPNSIKYIRPYKARLSVIKYNILSIPETPI